ncbi:putative protein kinase [Aspergillus tanneri]|uniref:Protein kinase domain-containing protein n=1 Tax=Aspergillus tanneri TaxID=1220188 RepID=A0A5M9MMD1_9EURO|nr:uncharacterized protein ATNIH1004_004058 [Aspergillus tanneri]KAA8648175.1 hypothetical protein ATNIH1004_004058 [Aspergillus tanneri]
MSMFKSAADISSSDSQSSDSESEDVAIATTTCSSTEKTSPHGKGTATAPVLTGESRGTSNQAPIDGLDINTEGHANIMTAALLEFYCLSRAADILNSQGGSHKRFTRDSPEVQFLGKKMYTYKSQFLSSHGVLASGADNDELGSTRQYYRDNLDMLGVSALEDLDLEDAQGQPPLDGAGNLVLASTTASLQIRSNKDVASLPSQQLPDPPGFMDVGSGAVRNFRLDLSSLPTRPLPLSGSSPVSFPLFDQNPRTPTEHMSRYSMEFSEVKILGRGSFGEVYHVRNHIDGQSYAVKKIPISQKRLEQLQCGSENQLENIMKEIRTLARLEHTNVVRYYGAWVEKVHMPAYLPSGPPASVKFETEQAADESICHESHEEQSFGIVFEHSESSTTETNTDYLTEQRSMTSSRSRRRSSHASHATVTSRSSKKSSAHSFGEEDEEIESIPRDFTGPSIGQMSTFGGTDNDVFTDGFSHDPSKLQVQRRHRSEAQIPAVVLHIQMSLHPISLSSYLSPEPYRGIGDHQDVPRRHCFHLVPSLKMMLRIISGVDYLHAKGIVHRDLKPANIFLSSPETRHFDGCPPCQLVHNHPSRYCHPRIGDFGLVADISHLKESSPTSPGPSIHNGGKVHRVVGTEFYRPPLVDKRGVTMDLEHNWVNDYYAIDETLDIYALGVILFELVYRLNTKMERQLVLSELTRVPHDHGCVGPLFPADFARKVDQGDVMLDDQQSVAESLMTCIKGMLDPMPHRRWNCVDTVKHLQRILSVAEKACSSVAHTE